MQIEEIAEVLEIEPDDVERIFAAMSRGKELADQVGDVSEHVDECGVALGAAMEVARENECAYVSLNMEEARGIYRVLWAVGGLPRYIR